MVPTLRVSGSPSARLVAPRALPGPVDACASLWSVWCAGRLLHGRGCSRLTGGGDTRSRGPRDGTERAAPCGSRVITWGMSSAGVRLKLGDFDGAIKIPRRNCRRGLGGEDGQCQCPAVSETRSWFTPGVTLVNSLGPRGMAAPSMKERQACWGARDEYWKCLDEKAEDASQCEQLRSAFESRCPQQWVRHTRRVSVTGSQHRAERLCGGLRGEAGGGTEGSSL